METKKSVYISGYRSYEMGVFNEKDPKIKIIKKAISSQLEAFIFEGTTWFIVSGNLGVELWAAQEVLRLKEDYPEIRLAILLPFVGWGENWNEQNKQAFDEIKHRADYVNTVSHKKYENPQQLKNHTQFLLRKTQGCLLVYDEEYPGKPHYFLQEAKEQQRRQNYLIQQILMDDLENSINSYDFN